MDKFLTNSIDIPFIRDKIVNGNTVDNLQSGGLLSDLKITKNGKVIAVDSDWDYFSTTSVVYVLDNKIQVTDQRVFNKLQIGTQILVTQTTDKYFYVIGKDEANYYIYLNAGDDYTYTSGSISAIAFSNKNNPIGFPQVFDFSTSLKVYTFVASTNDDSSRFDGGTGKHWGKYSLNGNIATIWYDVSTTNMRASAQSIILSSPFITRAEAAGGDAVMVTSMDMLLAGTWGGGTPSIDIIRGWGDQSSYHADLDLGLNLSARNAGTAFDSGTLGYSGQITINI